VETFGRSHLVHLPKLGFENFVLYTRLLQSLQQTTQ